MTDGGPRMHERETRPEVRVRRGYVFIHPGRAGDVCPTLLPTELGPDTAARRGSVFKRAVRGFRGGLAGRTGSTPSPCGGFPSFAPSTRPRSDPRRRESSRSMRPGPRPPGGGRPRGAPDRPRGGSGGPVRLRGPGTRREAAQRERTRATGSKRKGPPPPRCRGSGGGGNGYRTRSMTSEDSPAA
jgi:hypothetical protein